MKAVVREKVLVCLIPVVAYAAQHPWRLCVNYIQHQHDKIQCQRRKQCAQCREVESNSTVVGLADGQHFSLSCWPLVTDL